MLVFNLFLFDKFMVNFGCENEQKNSFEIKKKSWNLMKLIKIHKVSGVKLSNENKR